MGTAEACSPVPGAEPETSVSQQVLPGEVRDTERDFRTQGWRVFVGKCLWWGVWGGVTRIDNLCSGCLGNRTHPLPCQAYPVPPPPRKTEEWTCRPSSQVSCSPFASGTPTLCPQVWRSTSLLPSSCLNHGAGPAARRAPAGALWQVPAAVQTGDVSSRLRTHGWPARALRCPVPDTEPPGGVSRDGKETVQRSRVLEQPLLPGLTHLTVT